MLTGVDSGAPGRLNSSSLVQGRGFSVKEVVHHYDVLAAIIWPRRRIARNNLHSSDTSIAKDNPEEGQVSVARRSWRGALEKQLAASAEALDHRAGVTVPCPVSCSVSWAAAIWGVNVGKNHAKSSGNRWCVAIAARNRELDNGNVTPDRRKEPQRAKGVEDRGVARVPKRVCQARQLGLGQSRFRVW